MLTRTQPEKREVLFGLALGGPVALLGAAILGPTLLSAVLSGDIPLPLRLAASTPLLVIAALPAALALLAADTRSSDRNSHRFYAYSEPRVTHEPGLLGTKEYTIARTDSGGDLPIVPGDDPIAPVVDHSRSVPCSECGEEQGDSRETYYYIETRQQPHLIIPTRMTKVIAITAYCADHAPEQVKEWCHETPS